MSSNTFVCLLVFILFVAVSCTTTCPNGCSSRGLCINNVCVCAEGLTGQDCSQGVPSTNPTLYQCPSCYTLTVGPPQYYSGPSWSLPDGPIAALNYQGTLRIYQGNGNGMLVSDGLDIDDWLAAPVQALQSGDYSSGLFDMCGSWLMRAFTSPINANKVLGFYHAERQCAYNNGGQTRKSAGYSVSADGGYTFTKPGYATNKLVDTNSPVYIGRPSGEGDISVILRGNWFYMFFANVESWYTGVARATVWSEAYQGAFSKYYNGYWNQSAVGGLSSGLNGITGTQVYLHTPSQSMVAIGNDHPYWYRGFMLSASDDAVNWRLVGDPLMPADQFTAPDQFMYGSLLGATGGYDVGSKFKMFYMWGPDTARYQVNKDVSLTYVGYNSTNYVGTKIALTTFRSATSGETWQTTELPLYPYNTVSIVGYVMSRAYPKTMPIYDCTTVSINDHFVGTAAECFNAGSSVTVSRTLGYVYPARMPGSIAVYRCSATNDRFLSQDSKCEGRAAAQTVPFAYFLDGPAITTSQMGFSYLIPKGSSWKFYNKTITGSTWTQLSFGDSSWKTGTCPFANSYAGSNTFFGNTNYYFRSTFIISSPSAVQSLLLSVASDDRATVYINGVMVDSDPAVTHEAAYWNRRVYVSNSMLVAGINQIAVLCNNADNWALFDLELTVQYAASTPAVAKICSPTCANGQCSNGVCVCDSGWSGATCNTNKCSYSNPTTQTVVASGSSFKYTDYSSAPAPPGWFASNYDDSGSRWVTASAPFATTFYYKGLMKTNTVVTMIPHLYRAKFTISAQGRAIVSATLSISSDDTHYVYVNGMYLNSPVSPYIGHYAKQWNDVITIPGSFLIDGINQIAVQVPLVDGRWSTYFDMQLQVTFATKTCSS